MTTYKIINFDEATAQVTLRVGEFPPFVVDLPIDDEGNLPTGEALTQYLSGFIPTWHFERKQRLENGISNASAIASLVQVEEPTEAVQIANANVARANRNQALSDCDWTQLPDASLSAIEKDAWTAYRQALRDLPQQQGFPDDVVWPASPDAEPQ